MKHSITEYQDRYQINAIRIMSIIAVAIALPFGAVSLFVSDNYLMASIDFLAATSSFILLIKIRYIKTPRLWVLMYLCLAYSCVCAQIFIEPLDHATIFWIWTLPSVSILFLGLRIGSLVTAIFAPIALLVFLYRLHQAGIDDISNFMFLNSLFSLIGIWIFSCVYALQQQELVKYLNETATHDPLTGLHNRRHMKRIFAQLLDDQHKNGSPLSVLLLDIDHFKHLNDRFGHDMGDKVLEQLGAMMMHSTRQRDWIFRMGGEEFAILLPRTDVEHAWGMANRLREDFAQHSFPWLDESVHCTVSIGIASAPEDGTDYETLYRRADARMYQAKNEGRNRVVRG